MNEFFVSAKEETSGKSLTIVPLNRRKKFLFFYSKGEVDTSKKPLCSHT
jgi:hypothetical protein